jgi:molybdate transport system ATP-binding protein
MLDVRLRRDMPRIEARFTLGDGTTGLFGPSGAGKSTLLHMIAGLERPDEGSITLDGAAILDAPRRIDVPPHRRGAGMVFQDARLFPHRSVRGNLRYGERRRAARGAAPAFDEVVRLLALEPLVDRRIGGLSGGERQRVALGRAILSSPRVLLLDEPLASLDLAAKRELVPFLREVRDALRIPMLYVSHDLEEILQLTDELVLMRDGRVVACGPLLTLAKSHAGLDVLHDAGLTNVFALRVARIDAGAGLAALEAPATPGGAALLAPAQGRRPAEDVFVSVRPSDVALALAPVQGISIRNQLGGRVSCVTPHGGRAIIEVETGLPRPLLVEVSLRTVGEMRLEPGRAVTCLIKSNAIRCVDRP